MTANRESGSPLEKILQKLEEALIEYRRFIEENDVQNVRQIVFKVVPKLHKAFMKKRGELILKSRAGDDDAYQVLKAALPLIEAVERLLIENTRLTKALTAFRHAKTKGMH